MSNETRLVESVEAKIYTIRGQKVMLNSDLAELYQVETKYLNRVVKRNANRFPPDFMYELTPEEFATLPIASSSHGGPRYGHTVFTENGVAMLSSVLNSERAIEVNISIMRIFTKLRSFLLLEKNLTERIGKLEQGTNYLFKIVFERLDNLEEKIEPRLPENRRKIGLRSKKEE